MSQFDIEDVARICHEVNAVFCRSIGDNSQPAWKDAPEWQRKSAIAGVEFHLANPNAGPSGSHESWLRQKVADGWVYGSVKDASKKEHPCIVPFDKLPREQQFKDEFFVAIVRACSKEQPK